MPPTVENVQTSLVPIAFRVEGKEPPVHLCVIQAPPTMLQYLALLLAGAGAYFGYVAWKRTGGTLRLPQKGTP